jgi:GT2 family glycosyltransferase
MRTAADVAVAFVTLYPVVTAAVWVAGGVLFRTLDEPRAEPPPDAELPGVTVLIPAFNEEPVIATSIVAALASDYPDIEVLVLDDGSADGTEAAATRAAAGDARCEVIRDPVNRGKAEQLNRGFERARHELVVVTDADTHLHPQAIRLLVARMRQSPLVAAVAGAPHVTNRNRLICAMKVLEAASIIGLIRRTQALTGRVGTVAGLLGLFHRDRVIAVGGYDPRMATEDIDLTWRLLLAGWHTAYEPAALVGMQVSSTLRALWAQRKRWARGQGEVLHVHLGDDEPLAEPHAVAAQPRVARLAAVGPRAHGVARPYRDRARARRLAARVRLRARVGDRGRGRRHRAARGRRADRLCARPAHAARVPARPALPPGLLADLGRGRRARADAGARARPAPQARRLGHPARAHRRLAG